MITERAKKLANFEVVSGCILFLASLWLFFQPLRDPLEDPHGFVVLVALEVWLLSVVLICCGIALKKSSILKVPSQVAVLLAVMFIFVDFCTPYSGWYIGYFD